MNYADYQTYIIQKVWRVGDAELVAQLPEFIKMAETRIARDIRLNDIQSKISVTDFVGANIQLPADCGEVIILNVAGGPPAVFTTPFQVLANASMAPDSSLRPGRIGAVLADEIVIYPDAKSATTYDLYYYKTPVPYATDPVAPYRDEIPQLFDAAVLVHVHDFIREYDKMRLREQDYRAFMEDLTRDSYYRAYPSGTSQLTLPGLVF